jgi:hypothetical protein
MDAHQEQRHRKESHEVQPKLGIGESPVVPLHEVGDGMKRGRHQCGKSDQQVEWTVELH